MIQKLVLVAGMIFFLLLSGTVVGETSAAMNLKACLLVLGGTLMSVFLAFPSKTIKDVFKSLREISRNQDPDHQGLVGQIEKLARLGRLHGTKVLEEEGKQARNLFLRKGIELVVDGYDRYEIRTIMEKEYDLYFSRRESQGNVLNTLAKLAPVFGFVGTIIGLINVLANMGEPAEIGKGMALALLTTFYGLLFANFLFLPLSKKLSEHTKNEATLLNVIMEGIVDISEEKNSKSISHRLQSYLAMNHLVRADGMAPSLSEEEVSSNLPLQRFIARKQSA